MYTIGMCNVGPIVFYVLFQTWISYPCHVKKRSTVNVLSSHDVDSPHYIKLIRIQTISEIHGMRRRKFHDFSEKYTLTYPMEIIYYYLTTTPKHAESCSSETREKPLVYNNDNPWHIDPIF